MSTTPTPPAAPLPAAGSPKAPVRDLTIISHSMLFYWWPIWVFGYAFAIITYTEDHRLAIFPADTRVTVDTAKSEEGKIKAYEVVVKEPTTKVLEQAVRATSTPGEGASFKTRVSQRAWMGPLFCVILLLTVIITNVPLRGLWSFLVLLILLVVSLGISLVPNGWDSLLAALGNLHIYINLAGYLFIATAVLVLWFVSMYVFDQRTYMRVTPGQIAVCEHIGASIRNIDGARVEIEKKRDDLFRHLVWGFGSGDLVIRLDTKEEIRLPNVLRISWVIEDVQRLIREKATVAHP